MSLISVAVGLCGAPFFLSERASLQTIGALLFLAHSILDGCDGELARLKFEESRWGGVLDFWGDNVVHVVVFACMAIGWSLAAGAGWPLLLGAAAVIGTLGSAGLVYWRLMRGKDDSGARFTSVSTEPERPLARDRDAFEALYAQRRGLYEEVADAHLLWAESASGEYPVFVGHGLLDHVHLPAVWPFDRAASRPLPAALDKLGEEGLRGGGQLAVGADGRGQVPAHLGVVHRDGAQARRLVPLHGGRWHESCPESRADEPEHQRIIDDLKCRLRRAKRIVDDGPDTPARRKPEDHLFA